MSLFPRSSGPRTTNISDAVRDLEVNGENMNMDTGQQFAPIPPPSNEQYGAAMYGMAPPTQPPPNQPYYQQQGTPQEISTYIFISFNKESDSTKVEVLDEQEIMKRLEDLGLERSLTHLPTGNPAHWGGKFLIIKGSVVVPKEVRTIKLV